jgi:hypothetical protein
MIALPSEMLIDVAALSVIIGGGALIRRAGRELRAQLSPRVTGGGSAKATASQPASPVARTIVQKGLVSPAQLAAMTSAERDFFLATAAARLGDGTGPRLVRPRDGSAEPAPLPVTSAVLVTASIHCPVCRTPIGKRTEAPIQLARCPGCTRRVAARVDEERLVVTVDYAFRTPHTGVPVIPKQP